MSEWQCGCGCENTSIIQRETVVNYKGYDIDVPTEMLRCNHCASEFQVAYQLKEQKEFLTKAKAKIDVLLDDSA